MEGLKRAVKEAIRSPIKFIDGYSNYQDVYPQEDLIVYPTVEGEIGRLKEEYLIVQQVGSAGSEVTDWKRRTSPVFRVFEL